GLEGVRGQVFVLPPRTQVTGMVVAPDQRGVADAVVQATVLGLAVGAVPAARYNRSADTVSDAEGTFQLGLDVGTYDFVVKFPPESGFPWVARLGHSVDAAAGRVMEDFEFPAPIAVTGVLRDASGTAVPETELVAHGIVRGPDLEPRAVELGRAV